MDLLQETRRREETQGEPETGTEVENNDTSTQQQDDGAEIVEEARERREEAERSRKKKIEGNCNWRCGCTVM